MRVLYLGLALLVALAVQTTVVSTLPGQDAVVDLVLVVVLLAATSHGRATGLWAGTVGGLLQDALSGGLLGVGGLAKTLVGVGAGTAMHFILGTAWRRLVVVFLASVVHLLIYSGIYALISVQGPTVTVPRVLGQAVANTVVAALVIAGIQAWPGVVAKVRRRGRSTPQGWMVT